MFHRFLRYARGVIVAPGAAMDALARESSVRYAVLLLTLIHLLTGHPYAFTAAQNGELGPLVRVLWWTYMLGIYILGKDLWSLALGALAIRRVQKIPLWAAGSIMLSGYILWY